MTGLHTLRALVDAASAAIEFGANWFLQSMLLVTLGLVAGRLMQARGAAAQSAVYRTTLAAVLICPIASWLLSLAGASGWSVSMPAPWVYNEVKTTIASAAAPAVASPIYSEPAGVNAAIPQQSPATTEAFEWQIMPSQQSDVAAAPPVAADPAVDNPAPSVIQATNSIPETPEAESPTFSIQPFGFVALVLGAAWLMVSAVHLERLAAAWWLLYRLRRGAVPAEATIRRTCRELAARLGVAVPEVLCSPYLPSPCLVGLRRPAVLLPEVDLSLSIRDVLVHELGHLARGDCRWNLLRQLTLSVFFFQPLLWRLSRRLEATAEEVCDDYVVEHGGDPFEYAHRLVDIAELSTAPMAAAGVGIVSLRSMLAQRVQRIMDTSRSLSTRVGRLLLAVVLAGGLVGTLVVGLVGVGAQPSIAEVAAAADEIESQRGDDQAADELKPADATPDNGGGDEAIEVRGRVLDASGKPVGGATVRLCAGIGIHKSSTSRSTKPRPTRQAASRQRIASRSSTSTSDVRSNGARLSSARSSPAVAPIGAGSINSPRATKSSCA